jgi:hypothetical protein
MKQALHRVIEIDPAKFADQVPRDTDTGERIFDESDVLKFLIDALNEARISISMINHDHGITIEYRGQWNYFGIGLASLDAPDSAVIYGMTELSYILNDREGIESWTAYGNGKHALHILRLPDAQTAIKESPEMTTTEIREAEDNIESTRE